MNHSADLYQAFFNTASDPIFVLDAATKTIVKANAQAIKYTGYRPDEIAGLPVDRLFRSQNGVELLFFFQNADDATTLVGLQLLKKMVRRLL